MTAVGGFEAASAACRRRRIAFPSPLRSDRSSLGAGVAGGRTQVDSVQTGARLSQQLLSEWRQRLPPLAREASSCCRCWEQQTHRVSKEVGIAAVLQQLYSSLRCSTSEGFRLVLHFYPLSQSSNAPFNTDTIGAVSVAMTQVSCMHASFR